MSTKLTKTSNSRQLAALSKRLIAEFGKGYSVSNLEYMRGFHLLYRNRIPQSLTGKSPLADKSQSLIWELKGMPSASMYSYDNLNELARRLDCSMRDFMPKEPL